MKSQFKKFYDIDTFFLKPPTNIYNTINNIKKQINYNKEVKDILGENKISKLKNTLIHIQNPEFKSYDKYYEIDFLELLNMTWRFVQYYEPECMCIFLESLIDINKMRNNHTRIYKIYGFYKVHMLDKDDLFTINLI